jgi:hypothetical protein
MTTTLMGALEEQAQAAERNAAAMRKLVEAARDLGEERVAALLGITLAGNRDANGNGHKATPEPTTTETSGDVPRGREAVRRIVRERPGIWTLAKLRSEMKRRGWFTSSKGLDVAVSRLAASGEARRVGKGRYEFFAGGERRLL